MFCQFIKQAMRGIEHKHKSIKTDRIANSHEEITVSQNADQILCLTKHSDILHTSVAPETATNSSRVCTDTVQSTMLSEHCIVNSNISLR